MRVIGTVGLPGSGKGEFAAVAREEGVPVVSMGDVVRQACRDRGLDPADHHGRVAEVLRQEEGRGAIAARTLPLIESALEESEVVVVDGLRSGFEAERFEAAFGDDFTLVSIEAPFDVRRDRITDRGRDNPDRESLSERDARERGFGMDEAIDRADIRLRNTGSLREFRAMVHEVIKGTQPNT